MGDLTDRKLVEIVLGMGYVRGLRKVFDELCDENKNHISRRSFLRFLRTYQRDPRLNEARHPLITERSMDMRLKHIECPLDADISFETFVHYLWSDFCTDASAVSLEDGLQVKGAHIIPNPNSLHKEAIADVEIYRQVVLLSGCRCIELDCWDGSDGPVITHGPSTVMRMNEISLSDVCSAIAESAFKTSPYPVLLSIENHLSKHQQKQMVTIFRKSFGPNLLVSPLKTHPLVEHQELPSPYALRHKILIKAKRRPENEDQTDAYRKLSTLSSIPSVRH
ncbi:Phosphatidylinositol-specific phospholipase C, X domain protein [Necator americanus]|uniref:Phosphoinositide phospholipase C n=1 Tax=Necator americanus TaxID=51031 RepID=W2TMP7_NECAM|nr:Phosphatidylinositol-specific phospholipase C, X domain protein [Necator americanus]ETN82262.1 Phosphatidylinositol-specific phospholipase C, X domain protein [Necator americanus]